MRMTTRPRSVAAALLAAATLAACGTAAPAEISDADLAAELRAVDVEPAGGVAEWRTAMRSAVCESTEDVLELALTMRNVDETMLRGARVAASHYCPDRLPVIDARIAQLK